MITKEWMLVVNRSQATAVDIPIDSLAFLGLLYAKTPEQAKDIYERKPLEILTSVATPVFGRNSNTVRESMNNLHAANG